MPDHVEGNVGYLTHDQFIQLQWAFNDAIKHVRWWRVAGYTTSGETDVRVQRSYDHPLGLPPAWQAAEEVTRLMNELNAYHELEDAANDLFGHYLCINLIREVQTATARWPLEDRKRKVKYMRCQACHRLSLRYHPPRWDGDATVVQCNEADCHAYMDEAMFAFAAELILHENKLREERDRKRGLGDDVRGDGTHGAPEDSDLQVGGGRESADDATNEVSVAVPSGPVAS